MPDAPPRLDLDTFAGGCPAENGFPYPDWGKLAKHIFEHFQGNERDGVWNDVTRQWLEKLRAAFGTGCALEESQNFFLISTREPGARKELLAGVERTWALICRQLRGYTLPAGPAKRVIVLAGEFDEYYRYIARFFPSDENSLSYGVFIPSGYSHIVVPEQERKVQTVLTHELTHNAFFGLPLPMWVNEAMAQYLEAAIGVARGFRLDGELAQGHFAFWTPENIQEFWSGASFNDPDKSRMSYSLAEVLLCLMTQEGWNVTAFVQEANWRDAGQAAAVKAFRRTLGSVAGMFLGEGDWEPKPPTQPNESAA